MPNFFEIASSTLSTATSTVSFSNIPQTYTDLMLLISARNNASGTGGDFLLFFNNASTTYAQRYVLRNNNTGVNSTNTQPDYPQIGIAPGNTSASNTFTNTTVYIPSYTTAYYKPFTNIDTSGNAATTGFMWISANNWQNSAAITSIQIESTGSPDFVSNSTFYLYGIKNS